MDRVLELDIAEIYWNLTSLKDAVIRTLKERDLYNRNNFYRGFNKGFVEQVLALGSENLSDWGVYALPESHLSIDPDPRWINPLSYARASGALAVYNGDMLRLGSTCIDWYEFVDQTKRSESISTIFSLKW
ncbi:hypothetical protein HYX10_02675 [Candidatus Woesearchaeota archaeon]|nr:hypothetical protein [Candidatus Woesearchaeota archaeon]